MAGIAGAVVTALAGVITGAPPSPDDPTSEFKKFMIDKRDALRWQVVLFAIGIVLLIWFFATFSSLMARGDVSMPFAMLPTVATMGILGIGFGGAAMYTAVFWRGARGFDDSAIQMAYDSNSLATSMLSVAVLVIFLAAAVLIMRTGLLPAWLGWLAVVGAVINALGVLGVLFDPDSALSPGGALSVFGLMATMLWIVVTGVVMLRSDGA
jgi:hypothetical protein